MNSLLPQIADRNQYQELFKQNNLWEPAIAFLIQKHHLKGEVKRGVLGSHIVYRVGDFWIKLMAPIFAQDMAFEISGLKVVENRLSVRSPQILAEGNLEGWPYVVLNHIEGVAIRNLWPKLDQNQKENLSKQIAVITKELSQCKADKIIESRFIWNDFIKQQYESCEDQQRKKGLPETWLSHVGKFLQSFDLVDFQTSHPVFLHADLTFDHFLVTENPGPQISGIIDMADCQIGHFEYELVAPCTFIFKGNKSLLRHYLVGCGYELKQINNHFSEKLLAWSLLHRYFSMISYFQEEMNLCQPGDFSSLAKKVFPLNEANEYV